jgi:hypothetical protein
MAVRDFVDGNGVPWRVWPVRPEALQPRTAAEDYLGDYGDGWLCFESETERRRLAQFPREWEALSQAELCALLDTAAVVPKRKSGPRAPADPPSNA